MDVRLVVREGPARTRVVQVRRPETIIGRSRDCDICIPSAHVSRRHCLLILEEGRVMVEDLSSANGTFLNNEPIEGKLLVHPGDCLRIGPLTFTVEYSSRAVAGKAGAIADEPTVNEAEDGGTYFELVDAEGPESATKVRPPEGSDAEDAMFDVVELVPDDDAIGLVPIEPPPPPPGAADQVVDIVLDECDPLELPEGDDFQNFLGKRDR